MSFLDTTLDLGACDETISTGDIIEIEYIPTLTGASDSAVRKIVGVLRGYGHGSINDAVLTFLGNNAYSIETHTFDIHISLGSLKLDPSSKGAHISASGTITTETFDYGNPILVAIYKIVE